MVENRAAREPGGVLEAADGGTLVAEPREAVAGRREDLVAARVKLVLAYSGHGLDGVTLGLSVAIRTYVLPNRGTTRPDGANSVIPHKIC
jgi:hypothetical protein